MLPTFLEAANATVPDEIDGKSFYKTLQGRTERINDYVYGVATRQNIRACKIFPSRMVRGQRFKLIRNYNSHEVYEQNLGSNKAINAFIEIGAKSFPKTPYEELYDLEADPYQKKNLANSSKYAEEKKKLSRVLEKWMQSQNDFLLEDKMPLIKPSMHPLDKQSQWNKVSDDLVGTLKKEVYLKVHY